MSAHNEAKLQDIYPDNDKEMEESRTLEDEMLLAGGAVGSLEVDGEGAEAPVGGEAEGGARVEYLMNEGD